MAVPSNQSANFCGFNNHHGPVRIVFDVMPKLRLVYKLCEQFRICPHEAVCRSYRIERTENIGLTSKGIFKLNQCRPFNIIRGVVLTDRLPSVVMKCSRDRAVRSLAHKVAGHSEPRRRSDTDESERSVKRKRNQRSYITRNNQGRFKT